MPRTKGRNIRKLASGRYQARHDNPPGSPVKETSETFATEGEALAWKNARETEDAERKKRRGGRRPKDDPELPDYARRLAAGRRYAPTTRRGVDHWISRRIVGSPLDIGVGMSELGHDDVQEWINWQEDELHLGPTTIKASRSQLASVFNIAVADPRQEISASPITSALRMPKIPKLGKVVPLTVAQVEQLTDAMPSPDLQTMVIVQSGLGLRLGELCALRREDIIALRGTVNVEWQITAHLEHLRPKYESQRAVEAPQEVLDAIRRHMADYDPLPDDAEPFGGLIFYNTRRKPARRRYADAFDDAVAALVAADPTFPADTTTHDLRHHFASVMLAEGYTDLEVATMLGHENAYHVQHTYGHLMPDRARPARHGVDAAWRRHRRGGRGDESGAVGGSVE